MITESQNTKPKIRKGSGLWSYLDSIGILENGTDEQIKEARRAYRKIYDLENKRKQRKNKPEFSVKLSRENGEYETMARKANEHQMSVPAFIHESAFAYLNNTYIVPNRMQIAQLEQLLSQCLNEIQTIVRKKEKYHWEVDGKYMAIEKRIEKLESEISEALKYPSTLEDLVRKAIETNPLLKYKLITLISLTHYDSQNKVA